MQPEDWFGYEFEMVAGRTKIENAGRVKARRYSSDTSVTEWMGICDDFFNKEAAGAVCRSMGFESGRVVQPSKKMKPIPDLPFGMTDFWCMDDDTLATRLVEN